MIKVVLFDLDDTLISEKDYIESGYRYIAKALSTTIDKSEDVIYTQLFKLFHESPKNVFNRLYDFFNLPYTKSDVMKLVEMYRDHPPTIHFFQDVMPCLEFLKRNGLKTGIVTDGYANAQERKLEAVHAKDMFDEIIITDKLGREYWKPHPRAFETLKESFQVDFEEIIYVGDNPEKDFYIGNIYPIKTIRIHREGVYKDKKYLHDIAEHFSIQSLFELENVIEAINNAEKNY
jgi:putative hydrolase of the HAD superfamily